MNKLKNIYLWQEKKLANLHKAEGIVLFLARFYLAKIFFLSGLTKIRDWDSTIFLFQEEYKVPLLQPELAAYMGTCGELLLPPLLLLGFLTRFSSIGLLFVNIVAAISLPDITQAALNQHILWGVLLMLVTVFGGGKIAVEYFTSNADPYDNHILK